jgi:hypothetical protein
VATGSWQLAFRSWHLPCHSCHKPTQHAHHQSQTEIELKRLAGIKQQGRVMQPWRKYLLRSAPNCSVQCYLRPVECLAVQPLPFTAYRGRASPFLRGLPLVRTGQAQQSQIVVACHGPCQGHLRRHRQVGSDSLQANLPRQDSLRLVSVVHVSN